MSFQQAIVQLEKDRGVDSTNDLAELYGALGTLYFGKGQTALAQEFYDREERVRSASYNPITAENYRKLKRILDGKRIKLVCVQYPMRDVALLKKIFHGDDEGVLFVDNEKTFKEAVQKDGYKAYFVDMAGGDMGHCTETGNRLLAKNIADVILKKEFHR